METIIKYRNGVPTKASIRALFLEFDPTDRFWLSFGYSYGDKRGMTETYNPHYLNWQRKSTQELVLKFTDFLAEKGVQVGTIRDYNGKDGCTGQLTIKPK